MRRAEKAGRESADREFFEDYSPDQIDWVTQYGEEICMIAFGRYGED